MQINQHFLKKLAPDGKGRGARAERKRGTDREGSPGQPVCGGISPRKKKSKTFLRSDCYSFLLFLKDIPSVYENCFYATVKFFAVKRSCFSFAAEKF